MKKLILVLITTIMVIGCTDPEPIKLNLVFDNSIAEGKYPSYFKDIVMPFKTDCDKEFLLKPIYVTRLDIGKAEKETNAWFFENTGDNTVEFSTGWLEHYFTDSLAMDYLVTPPKRQPISIKTYLKEGAENVFIYSENSEIDEFEGFPIYSSSKDINKAIQSNACVNSTRKAIVLVNPKEAESSMPPPDRNTDDISGKGDSNASEKIGDPCSQNTLADALDLKEDLLKIVNTNLSYAERDKIARQTWNNYFDPMASVTMYLDVNDKHPDFWESGDGKNYLVDRLAFKNSIRDINIIRLEYHKETKKITAMITAECHDASQIQ